MAGGSCACCRAEWGDVDVHAGLTSLAACFAAGALSSLLLARWSGRLALGAAHLGAFAGAVAGLAVSLAVLLGDGATVNHPLPRLFPWATLSLTADGLS